MKNTFQVFGIVVLFAAIGLSITACGDDTHDKIYGCSYSDMVQDRITLTSGNEVSFTHYLLTISYSRAREILKQSFGPGREDNPIYLQSDSRITNNNYTGVLLEIREYTDTVPPSDSTSGFYINLTELPMGGKGYNWWVKGYETITRLEPYDDIRDKKYHENQYNKNDIITYSFNEGTVLDGSKDIQKRIMENGKNPGLGVRSLHKQGITGKGVNVAIIDQNLLLNHPEFAGKITYYDTGCGTPENSGSMHGPAVTSLLVGKSTGTAPDAKVYYAAAPSWTGDSKYYSDALNWIIEENKKLPNNKKIRVVSVSAAPSGNGSPFTKNLNMWDQAVLAAQQNGILVLDCRDNAVTGFIWPAFYDPSDPENPAACTGGSPKSGGYRIPDSGIGVPNSRRTTAEEYNEGSPSYVYWGQGGLSWAIPYAAGVLALGWQVNPNLSNDEIIQILFDTRARGSNESPIINPVAFIDAVKKTLK